MNGYTGATADHGTVSTASRSLRRCGSTGTPSRTRIATISRQRTLGPNTPWPDAWAHARSAAANSAWIC